MADSTVSRILLAGIVLSTLAATAFGQTGKDRQSPARIQEIIKQLATNESRDRDAYSRYTFRRSVIIQSFGSGNQITGEYNRVSLIGLNAGGSRTEKITFFPTPTLSDIPFTINDLENMSGGDPFALDSSHIDLYKLTYLGTEKIDDLTTFVFDVTPKAVPDPRNTQARFFEGRVWIDDRDLDVVKTRGRSVPKLREYNFPSAETYREQIDGKYWFPTYAYSKETLDSGRSARPVDFISQIKYTEYRSH